MPSLEDRLRHLLGPEGYRLFLEGLRVAEETGDPAWLYHALAMLYPGYYGGETYYPLDRSEEYYKPLTGPETELPPPLEESGVDALEAIRRRRSRRSYRAPLGLEEVASLLYYTNGMTGTAWWGGPKRAYPSAGALQPVEAYLVAGRVEGLEPGVYYYHPGRHTLIRVREGDHRGRLARIALDQEHVARAPASIVLTAFIARTASKYGYRSYRYTHWDAGHAGENLYIAAEALGLATVAVGAFYDQQLCNLVRADCKRELPMLIYPVGRRTR